MGLDFCTPCGGLFPSHIARAEVSLGVGGGFVSLGVGFCPAGTY